MPDFWELVVIATIAILVIPPHRLPQAARTLGQWIGKMQNYVAQVRADFDREFQLADLRRMGEEARSGVRSVESAVRGAVGGVQAEMGAVSKELMGSLQGNSWSSGEAPSAPMNFPRRYRPRPTIDDVSQDLERIKRRLSVPELAAGGRRKYAPRARVSRVRVRR